MYNKLGISKETISLVEKCEKACQEEFNKIDEI